MSLFAFMQLHVQYSCNLSTYYILHKRRLTEEENRVLDDAFTFM